MHGLRVLDNHVGSVTVVDRLAEARLYLLEVVEDWNFTRIEFHDTRFFRSDKRYVVFYFLEYLLVIHVDILVARVEQVA